MIIKEEILSLWESFIKKIDWLEYNMKQSAVKAFTAFSSVFKLLRDWRRWPFELLNGKLHETVRIANF
jgi:hypothetical protein